MELKEMIKVMQHYADGGEVEYTIKEDEHNSWIRCPNPLWDWFEFDYRIKEPKQKVTIEKWLCRDSDGDVVIFETSNVDKNRELEKVKFLESYEIEL